MAFKTPKLKEEDRREIRDQAIESWVAFIKDHGLKADQMQSKFTKRALRAIAGYLGVVVDTDAPEAELATKLEAAIQR